MNGKNDDIATEQDTIVRWSCGLDYVRVLSRPSTLIDVPSFDTHYLCLEGTTVAESVEASVNDKENGIDSTRLVITDPFLPVPTIRTNSPSSAYPHIHSE